MITRLIIAILILLSAGVLLVGSCKTPMQSSVRKNDKNYRLLKCGLYLSSEGELAYLTIATSDPGSEDPEIHHHYISWMYYADPADSADGGLKPFNTVIDTATFRIQNFLIWSDKNHVYGYNPMADGGTVYVNVFADPKTHEVLGDDGYARDRNHVFYRGRILEDADLRTFHPVKSEELPELAADKKGYFQAGSRLSEAEQRELHLK